MTDKQAPLPAWSARVGDLPASGRALKIEATAEERRAIADAYGVAKIESFRAELLLQPRSGDGVRLSGRLQVTLTQTCVVSLRPVAASIDESFERVFLPAERIAPARAERRGGGKPKPEFIVELEEEEPPEPLHGDRIDVAAVLMEEFALALDPYPRHPDAVLEEEKGAGDRHREDSPFAVLRGARGGKKD